MTALGYATWLKQNNYSSNTSRNYLSDIAKFSFWLKNHIEVTPTSPVDVFFTVKNISLYLDHIYHQKHYARLLASLRSYCQYCQDQNIIQKDIVSITLELRSKIGNSENTNHQSLLAEFKNFLMQSKSSPNTIKSYLSDITEFLKNTNA